MTLDAPSSERLLKFCSRLPGLPASDDDLEREARFVLQCLTARRQAIETGTHTVGGDLAAQRCEIEALDAARGVIRHLCGRRLGGVLDDI